MADEPFIVTGAEPFSRVARHLRELGGHELRQELRKQLVAESKPMRLAIRQAAKDDLPKKGGLNRWAARTPTMRVTYSGRQMGVRLTLRRAGHDIKAINRGRLRHPVFGNRGAWVTQSIAPGFFDKVVASDGPEMRSRVLEAIRVFVQQKQL